MSRSRPWWGMAIVRGVSMQPTLADGDRVWVSYRRAPRVGEVALVRFSDGIVAVKRIEELTDTGAYVSRDNPAQGRDSWTMGGELIPLANLLGSIRVRLWPRPGCVTR